MTVKTFSYTGAFEDWVVPAGVTSITIDGYGGGTLVSGGAQALGGRVQCTLPVTPAETLRVFLGGGATGTAAGFNGGAASGTPNPIAISSGGAGATEVRQGGTALSNRVVVMGGAGGSGSQGAGGKGGGTTGQAGTDGSGSTTGGGGGTPSAGGAAGSHGVSTGNNGVAGGSGVGGAGGGCVADYPGGGGGGGYFGGGGGGGGTDGLVLAGSGGGGSSFTGGTVTGVTHTQGYASATSNGALSFTYTAVLGTLTAGPTNSTLLQRLAVA